MRVTIGFDPARGRPVSVNLLTRVKNQPGEGMAQMSVEMTIRVVLIASLLGLVVIGFAMGEDSYKGHRNQAESPEPPHPVPEVV